MLDAATTLRQHGLEVPEISLPLDLPALTDARLTINDYKIGRALSHEWGTSRQQLSPRLATAVARGRGIPMADYMEAQQRASAERNSFLAAMAGYDALLVLAAAGEAPAGLESTGDSRFQGLWTLLHGPAVVLPTHRGALGLPVGIQLVAPYLADTSLLSAAAWVMRVLSKPRVN